MNGLYKQIKRFAALVALPAAGVSLSCAREQDMAVEVKPVHAEDLAIQ